MTPPTSSLLAVAIFAAAFSSTSGKITKNAPPAGPLLQPEVRSCEELIDQDGLDFRVATKFGVGDACAAAKLAGHFECSVSSIGFDDAEAQCAAVGARLCTFDELNQNVGRGLGCPGMYDDASMCWTSDDGASDASMCEEGEAVASRCRGFNGGIHQHEADESLGTSFCRQKSAVGSLVCCASGGVAERRVFSETCAQHTCGFDCSKEPGCGWNTPHSACMADEKTMQREMLNGDCAHVDRSQVNMNRLCRNIKCGAECAAFEGCGWSMKLMECKPGKKTSPKEMNMGICDDTDEASRFVDCGKHTCGWDCAQEEGCGWSSATALCLLGRSTSKAEWGQGVCSDDSLNAAGIDPCTRYTCGSTCPADKNCGWSTNKQECQTGKSTRPQELTEGTGCPTTTAPPPTLKEFCEQLICGSDCAASFPLCGWASEQNKCTPGGTTSNGELNAGFCQNSTTCERHTCGSDCAEEEGCGWSFNRGRCITGGSTSDSELEIGLCYGDTTSTTSSVTSKTTTTATETSATTTTHTSVTTSTATDTTTTATGSSITTGTTTTRTTEFCENLSTKNGKAWQDKDGDICEGYVKNLWCAVKDGEYTYGVGWGSEGDEWATYTKDGMHAGQACCACGGGSSSDFDQAAVTAPTAPPTKSCEKDINDPVSFFGSAIFGRSMLCGMPGWGEDKCGQEGWHSDFVEPKIGVYNDVKTQADCAKICLDEGDACKGFQHKQQHMYCEIFKDVKFATSTANNKKWTVLKRNTFC